MAVVVYPLDAVSGAPSYTGRMLRETLAVLLAGATTARPLGIRSGVRPGTPSSTISVSGTTVTIGEHAGAIDAEAAGEAGPYLYAVNANFTQALTTADASNPRTDAFGIQISDPAEADGTVTPGGAVVYVVGTAGVGAPLPTLPARFLLLGTASVPKVGAGSPTVSWVAPVLAAAGGVVDVRTIAERDAWTTPNDGQMVHVIATEQTFQWLATATTPHWQLVAGKPDVGTITLNPTFKTNTGSLAPQVQRVNGRCYLDGAANILANGTVIPNNTNITFGTIAAGFRPITTVAGLMRFGASFGFLTVNTDGTVVFQTAAGGTFAADAVPMGMAGVSWPDARL